MKQFRFRALVTLDPSASCPDRRHDGPIRHLVHAQRLDNPARGKYLPATILTDDGEPLQAGRRQVATIAVADDDALSYLAPGQPFTLWGRASGRGVISRRVFTDQGPS